VPHPGEVASRGHRRWTDTNQAHDERGLKHRAADETRRVPILPELVATLRTNIGTFGVAPDCRIFSSDRGSPYDLRHVAVSLWLAAGGRPTPRS
jgi:integrase